MTLPENVALLPTAYVVRREGYVLTRVCPSVCSHLGGGLPRPGPGGGGGVPQPGPFWGGVLLPGGLHLPGGYPLPVGTPLRVPPSDLAEGGGGYCMPGGYCLLGSYPTSGNTPRQTWPGGYPLLGGSPCWGGTPPRVPPVGPGWGVPPAGVWGVPQSGAPSPSDLAGGGVPPAMGEYLIRRGRYASRVHAGVLSCVMVYSH